MGRISENAIKEWYEICIPYKKNIHLQLNNDFPQAIHMVSHAAKES